MTADRRSLLGGAGAVLVTMILPARAQATPEEVTAEIDVIFGAGAHEPGAVTITVPPLAETGNAVPLTVTVDSPMTADDRILRLALFSERNPRPRLAQVTFGPRIAVASLTTNIRLNGTQRVICIAERSDGVLLRAEAEVRVVVGACTTLNARY